MSLVIRQRRIERVAEPQIERERGMDSPRILDVQLVPTRAEAVDDVDVRFRIAAALAACASRVAAEKVLKRREPASGLKRERPLRRFPERDWSSRVRARTVRLPSACGCRVAR